MSIDKVFRDWSAVRNAFLDEPERPTYPELAARFGIPLGSLSVVAADQGWALLRAQKLQRALADCDAAGALVAAAKGERLVTDRFRELAVIIIAALIVESGQLPEKQRGKLNALQTMSFTALNIGQALKAVGIIGLPKELRDGLKAGEDGNPDGFRGALANLNVMIQAAGGVTVSSGKAFETTPKADSQSVDVQAVSSTDRPA